MSTYIYQQIDSSQGQFRLLTLPWDVKQYLGRANVGPLSGTLTNHFLPISTLSRARRLLRISRLPLFYALSYVWGEFSKSQEILIDGKSIPITQNLYDGLRAMQKNSIGPVRVWADALCICQDDMAERSAQILLMREIYHAASEVCIWLGSTSEDGERCFQFIDSLTRAWETVNDPVATEDDPEEEAVKNVILKPFGALARASCRIGQAAYEIGDTISPAGLDHKAELLVDPDAEYSLYQDESGSPAWRPSAKSLAKVKHEGDFSEITGIISRIFMQNDWFSRMWVVQEVGVASSAEFRMGGMSMGWGHVFDTICYLHYTREIPVEGIRRIIGLERIRGGWNERRRHPLQDLMRECRYRFATDPRDKIYSLLGLMGDRINDYLRPDYSKSVGNVYSDVTRHFISQSESLDPICGWQTVGRNIYSAWGLPSWTPDYSLDQEHAPAPLVPIDRRGSIYAASGFDHRSKFQVSVDSTHPEWKSLKTRGICIDSVARLSNPGQENETFGSKATRWLSTLSSAKEFLKGLTTDVQSSLVDLSSLVSKFSDHHYSVDQSTLNLDSFSSISFLQENPILEAFLQTLLLGRFSARERLTKSDIEDIINMKQSTTFSESETTGKLHKTCQAFEDGLRRKRLLISEKGSIGSAPQPAEEGDILCVLFGCSVPVILRKLHDEDIYEFVGECYLNGFMDAEAIALQVKGVLKEQDFILV